MLGGHYGCGGGLGGAQECVWAKKGEWRGVRGELKEGTAGRIKLEMEQTGGEGAGRPMRGEDAEGRLQARERRESTGMGRIDPIAGPSGTHSNGGGVVGHAGGGGNDVGGVVGPEVRADGARAQGLSIRIPPPIHITGLTVTLTNSAFPSTATRTPSLPLPTSASRSGMPWTPSEDAVLEAYISAHAGPVNWKKAIPGLERDPGAARKHWVRTRRLSTSGGGKSDVGGNAEGDRAGGDGEGNLESGKEKEGLGEQAGRMGTRSAGARNLNSGQSSLFFFRLAKCSF